MTALAVVVPGPQSGRPDNLIALSGPLVPSAPVALSLRGLGSVDINTALSGFAWKQDNPVSGERRNQADLDSAELFLQKIGGWIQFLIAAGASALPSLGAARLNRKAGL